MSEDDQFLISMMEGKSKFQGARSRAFWKEIINHLRGKPAELLSFEDIKQKLRLREESYRGLQDVPLDRIAGSVGRYREFTRDFLPKERQMEERWSRVYATASSLTGFPPIELYKIGDVYFVRDGNHRVSVARQLGAKSIESHVTELPTSVDIGPGMTEQELHDAAAYAAFLDETGLSKTRPHHHSLQLSERLRYSDLLGHIYLHQSLLEHMAGHKLGLEQAATDWYDTVYRPAITLIQKYNMKETLGARTEADLYLWLVDHLRDLRGEFGEESPSHKISDALVDFLSDRKITPPDALLEEDDDSVIVSRTQMMRAVSHIAERERARAKDSDEQGDS
jgi:hypothetical protein